MASHRKRSKLLYVGTALAAVVVAASFVGAAIGTPQGAALASVETQTRAAQDTRDNCQLLADDPTTGGEDHAWAVSCVRQQQKILDLLHPTTTTSSTTSSPSSTPSTTPSPSPTTTPTATSAPARPWPNASNTGVPTGITMKKSSGRTITSSISNEDITGCVTIGANNITLTNVRIRCSGEPINSRQRSGVVIQDSELDCLNSQGTGASGNFTALRLNVHGCENGFSLDGQNTVKDNYIHDIYEAPGGHDDGIQVYTGAGQPIVIEHNWIENLNAGATSAIIADTSFTGLKIRNNRLIAHAYFVLRCPQGGSNNEVTNNSISGSTNNPPTQWIYCGNEALVSGNIDGVTGRPLPLN